MEPIVVLPDVYQLVLPTPFPVGPVNIYAARGADGVTLVDCGPRTAEARAALQAGLAQLGYSIADIRRIVVTHAHADHYGLAGELAGESNAEILTHPFNRQTLGAYQDERDQRLAFYTRILRASGVASEALGPMDRMRRSVGDYAAAVQVSGELEDGDELDLAGLTWQVIHTPGHSAGLICLYEPRSRVLLSSDHLLRDISSNPLIEPPPPGCDGRLRSLVEYLDHLQRVAAMDISTAWPGHGQPVDDVRQLVSERLEFHARRAEAILEILGQNDLAAYEVAQALFDRLDPLNFFLAISEVVGHLEWLESRGQVRSTQRGQVLTWRSAA